MKISDNKSLIYGHITYLLNQKKKKKNLLFNSV